MFFNLKLKHKKKKILKSLKIAQYATFVCSTAVPIGTTSVLSSGTFQRCLVVSRSLESKMADLLGDDSPYTDDNNEDPAADFLAREQDALADLGEDLDGDSAAAEVRNIEVSSKTKLLSHR